MERKKRSKGRGWESCYVKKIYGTFGVEMRAYGQKLVKFCTHTHTRLSYSSNDIDILFRLSIIHAIEWLQATKERTDENGLYVSVDNDDLVQKLLIVEFVIRLR